MSFSEDSTLAMSYNLRTLAAPQKQIQEIVVALFFLAFIVVHLQNYIEEMRVLTSHIGLVVAFSEEKLCSFIK
jgi:hypothetical protein